MKQANRSKLRPASDADLAYQRNLKRMQAVSRQIGAISLSPAKRKARKAFAKLSAG